MVFLGRVHRHVRAPHKVVHVIAVAREARDADARADVERQLVDDDRLRDARQKLLRKLPQRSGIIGVAAWEHREFVASESRDQSG